MPTARSQAMAERRARREGEEVGRKNEKALEAKPGWYDKRRFAAYFDTSIRTVERWMAEGMPHAVIGGKIKFKLEESEPWLERTGKLERKGDF